MAAAHVTEKDEQSEKKIALNEVPQAAVNGAKTQLTSITKAEVVKLKDGRTVYEIRGQRNDHRTVELYVSADGQVLGTEHGDRDKD